MNKKSKPETNSDVARSFFYGLSWAAVLLALFYMLNDRADRSLVCGFSSLVFFVLSHLEYRDLD